MFTLTMLGIAVVLLGLGVLAIRTGRRFSGAHAAFVRTGLLTDALVVDVVSRLDRNSRQPGPAKVYFYPIVEFTAPDGRPITARTMYGVTPRPPARKGDTVQVRFDPQDPNRVALTKGMASGGAVAVIQTVLGSFLIAFGLLVALIWAVLKLLLNVPA